MERFCRCLAQRKTRIFQIFYLSLLFGGYSIVISEIYPVLSNQFLLAPFHKFLSFFLFLISLLLFAILSFREPGILSKGNLNHKKYSYHKVLYPKNKHCPVCDLLKIPRSKHCRVCNQCISRFDHHCIWFNNCIGSKNIGIFLLFLFITFVTSGYAVFLVTGVFMHKLPLVFSCSFVLVKAQLSMNSTSTQDLEEVLPFILHENRALVSLGTVALVSWFSVGLFFGIQLKRTLKNNTSNECYKREIFLLELEETKVKHPKLDATWGGTFEYNEPSIVKEEKTFTKEDILFNPYDKGVWNNLCEVFSISLLSLSKAKDQ